MKKTAMTITEIDHEIHNAKRFENASINMNHLYAAVQGCCQKQQVPSKTIMNLIDLCLEAGEIEYLIRLSDAKVRKFDLPQIRGLIKENYEGPRHSNFSFKKVGKMTGREESNSYPLFAEAIVRVVLGEPGKFGAYAQENVKEAVELANALDVKWEIKNELFEICLTEAIFSNEVLEMVESFRPVSFAEFSQMGQNAVKRGDVAKAREIANAAAGRLSAEEIRWFSLLQSAIYFKP